MATETRRCRICDKVIPPGRLKVIPDTLVCTQCSEEIGGEFELEITISSTGKPGSLKKTGEQTEVRRQRKPFR